MSMMASQILKSVDFIKKEKSRYLENETLFFLQIKKNSLITYQGVLYGVLKVTEVTFKNCSIDFIV